MEKISFLSTIEKIPTVGGWHIIRIPSDILVKLQGIAGRKGNIPVLATIGETTWATTTMSSGEQQWFIAVSASVRKAENLSEGDSPTVSIRPDQSRMT